ncbi:hypothetical protein BBJ29_006747 [Phytophthora kernoviae]|uniref:Uncharacterized protein n=1 Tax=Phytophthora kernoviae TaxID=325452 RepID=A0A3F2RHK8_9STRA|nr:hypothetical protein BBJ29_006747 [Phytophthora kernoviae]RLN55675.1 hypothetical protein BBP00_00008389 [Phytophthora kernoviae]
MEFGGSAQFPSLTPRSSELYGATGGAFRVGEADSYASELDELDREERALETMVQDLVNRQAAVPIGVKFHREDVQEEEEEEDEEEEDEEDEMMIEEEVTNQRATIVRGMRPPPEEDSFDEGSADDSMDMDMELPPPNDWN